MSANAFATPASVESAPMQHRIEQIIAEWVPEDGDFIPSIVAQKLHARLVESDPATLDEWLHERAVVFLTSEISRYLNGQRQRVARRSAARAFHAAVEDGDTQVLGHFAVTHVVTPDNTRRRVADMVGADHVFVASCYQDSGKYDLMRAAFHRAVGKKVGNKRTADVMTEQQYDELLQSFVKRPA